jgi:hypothetical protein
MLFLASEKKLQIHTLPRLAKPPDMYRFRLYTFCLPLEFTAFNRLGIIWHSSALQGLTNNHLCSSQVFAVNLLFPFIHYPKALTDLRPHAISEDIVRELVKY